MDLSLSLSDIEHIAHLARLELTEGETKRMRISLNDFFGFIAKIHTVNTDDIKPLAHPIEQIEALTLPLRDDLITEAPQRDAYQRSAPAVREGLYLVPRVIE